MARSHCCPWGLSVRGQKLGKMPRWDPSPERHHTKAMSLLSPADLAVLALPQEVLG